MERVHMEQQKNDIGAVTVLFNWLVCTLLCAITLTLWAIISGFQAKKDKLKNFKSHQQHLTAYLPKKDDFLFLIFAISNK